MKSVLVGMSGGVDSAVAALLLKKQGFNVVGYTLKFGEKDNKCCRIDDAEMEADRIGIDYKTIDIYDEFEENIIRYFIDEYKKGRTPSPCPICNRYKFGIGLEYAEKNGIDFIATGHYASIKDEKLCTSPSSKDQAYFLSRLPKKFIVRMILPLGNYVKEDVRKIARKHNLVNAGIKESQDICFVKDDYRNFLRQRGVKTTSGEIIDTAGDRAGEHFGIVNYTIGQRYRKSGLKKRMYIIEIDTKQNRIIVGNKSDLKKNKIICSDLNLLADEEYLKKKLLMKVHSRDEYHPCLVNLISNNELIVDLSEPVTGVSPGQLAVLYYPLFEDKKLVVGSAWIEKASLEC